MTLFPPSQLGQDGDPIYFCFLFKCVIVRCVRVSLSLYVCVCVIPAA